MRRWGNPEKAAKDSNNLVAGHFGQTKLERSVDIKLNAQGGRKYNILKNMRQICQNKTVQNVEQNIIIQI